MARLVTTSRVHLVCSIQNIRNSGEPELRRHPRLDIGPALKTCMPATSAGMTSSGSC